MKTAKLRDLLRQKILGPEGQGAQAVFIEEVTAGPDGGGRRLDAISMGLWRSRGLLLEGYELKTSRRDWLGELREPGKAEPIARYMDRFWLVIGDESVIDGVAEVPANWGVMCAAKNGRGVSILRDAKDLEPEPLTPNFLASLLRRLVRGDLRREAKALAEEAEQNAQWKVESALNLANARADAAEERAKEMQEAWETFKELTGETFPDWLSFEPEVIERTAKVVAALRSIDPHGSRMFREDPVQELDRALVRVDRARGALASARSELVAAREGEEVAPTANP